MPEHSGSREDIRAPSFPGCELAFPPNPEIYLVTQREAAMTKSLTQTSYPRPILGRVQTFPKSQTDFPPDQDSCLSLPGVRVGGGVRKVRAPVARRTWALPPALPWQQAPPEAATGAHQNLQVGPCWRQPCGRWGRRQSRRLLPGPPPPRAKALVWRLPEGVLARARPPPTAGPPPALSPRSSWLFLASRTPSLGTWSVHGNTLGPAHRPRKCEAAAKPRPARVYGNCPQAPNRPPPHTLRPALGR